MSSSIQRLADALAVFDSYRDALEAMRRERINFDEVLTRRAAAVSSVVSEARRLANMEARCASGSTAGDDVKRRGRHNPDIREDTVRQARDIPCDASATSIQEDISFLKLRDRVVYRPASNAPQQPVVTGFGEKNGRPIVYLDHGHFAYLYQIDGIVVSP